MAAELEQTLREVRDTLLSEPVSPRVEEPADINLQYCQYVAETVVERLDDNADIEIVEDGGRGSFHTWITYDGCHYDAECVEGVADHRDLPFFKRHPEAAIHIEPATADSAALRQRGKESVNPTVLTFNFAGDISPESRIEDWKYVLAGLLLGGTLIAVGLSGEWALHRHLILQSAHLQTLFIDLEIIGEFVLLVSPVVFLVLVPAHRADSR